MRRAILTLGGILLAATSVVSCRQTEKTEAITAEITAAQMEGRNDARWFINNEQSRDFNARLDSVHSRSRRYREQGKNDCGEAYDSAFVSTIRTVKPHLTKRIVNY